MKLEECYSKLEGDFAGVRSRLMRDASISKFLIMFLKDTQYNEFRAAYSAGEFENAFRNIHTLKGTCLNLGISKLAEIAADITEELRGGAPKSDLSGKISALAAEYERTVALIQSYSENPEV